MRPNPQETADLVTFTEEIRNGKLQFCAVLSQRRVLDPVKDQWRSFLAKTIKV